MGFTFSETVLEGSDRFFVRGEVSATSAFEDVLESLAFGTATETSIRVFIVSLVQQSSYR